MFPKIASAECGLIWNIGRILERDTRAWSAAGTSAKIEIEAGRAGECSMF